MPKKVENSSLRSVELSRGNYIPESYEEYVFAEWCATLIRQGYIDEAYRPDPIQLLEPVKFNFIDTKGKEKDFSVVRKSAYQGDMIIKWNKKAHGLLYINSWDKCHKNPSPQGAWCKTNFLFYCLTDESLIDVKGTFTPTNNTPFSRTQQVCAMQGHYVQKVIPLGKVGLFMLTFAPLVHLYTPVQGKRRKGFQGFWEWQNSQKTILANEQQTKTIIN